MFKRYHFEASWDISELAKAPCTCPGRLHHNLTRRHKGKTQGLSQRLAASASYPTALGQAVIESWSEKNKGKGVIKTYLKAPKWTNLPARPQSTVCRMSQPVAGTQEVPVGPSPQSVTAGGCHSRSQSTVCRNASSMPGPSWLSPQTQKLQPQTHRATLEKVSGPSWLNPQRASHKLQPQACNSGPLGKVQRAVNQPASWLTPRRKATP